MAETFGFEMRPFLFVEIDGKRIDLDAAIDELQDLADGCGYVSVLPYQWCENNQVTTGYAGDSMNACSAHEGPGAKEMLSIFKAHRERLTRMSND